MLSRRQFIRKATASASLAALPGPISRWGLSTESLEERTFDSDPTWRSVQQSFTIDRSVVHLNNGGVSPAPISVQHSEIQHLENAHRQPFYALLSRVSPQIESIRRQIADYLGCDAEELAFTSNTSEGMEIVQLGLKMKPGDEIITTSQDYPRMLRTWEQRIRRDGIVVHKVDIPVPLANPAILVERIAEKMNQRTRLVMCCHMVDLTGQVLPIRAICDAVHKKDIPVLVDGAQTPGQLSVNVKELNCDFFATSLHKWTMGPQGTGCLFVRKSHIPDIWPLMSSDESLKSDIRKFEDTGTSPPSRILALADALSFQQSVGRQQIVTRLVELRGYWLDKLLEYDRVILKTELSSAGSLATIDIDGVDPLELRNHLWDRFRIRVRPIRHDAVKGIRVSAGIYNTKAELDYLVEALTPVIRFGLPKPT